MGHSRMKMRSCHDKYLAHKSRIYRRLLYIFTITLRVRRPDDVTEVKFIIAPFQEETFVWDNDPWESIIHMTSLSWTPFGVMPEVSFNMLFDAMKILSSP